MISVTTDGSFQHVRYAQRICNLTQITFVIRPILHYRGPANDFELSNLREIIEDLALHPISEIDVNFICADVLERKDRNALFGWYRLNDSLVKEKSLVTREEKPGEEQSDNAQD